MWRIEPALLALGIGLCVGAFIPVAGGPTGGPAAPARNGDVNGDGIRDLSDAVHLLNWLFLGGPEPIESPCPPPLERSLPDTGQSQCYDSFGQTIDCASPDCPGQDGLYAANCPSEGRFVDHGDGTVTDNCTGLRWRKDTSMEPYSWCEALAYCRKLDPSGLIEWRLPSVRELSSLVDYGRTGRSIDPVFEAEPRGYWTATSQADSPQQAWCVVFSSGTAEPVPKDFSLLVRAVRAR